MNHAGWRQSNRTARDDIAEQLVDDYTLEEFMADICTAEEPCPWCRARLTALQAIETAQAFADWPYPA